MKLLMLVMVSVISFNAVAANSFVAEAKGEVPVQPDIWIIEESKDLTKSASSETTRRYVELYNSRRMLTTNTVLRARVADLNDFLYANPQDVDLKLRIDRLEAAVKSIEYPELRATDHPDHVTAKIDKVLAVFIDDFRIGEESDTRRWANANKDFKESIKGRDYALNRLRPNLRNITYWIPEIHAGPGLDAKGAVQ